MFLDPCEDMTCSFNAICVVNSNYKASCRCPKCPPTTRHVCGGNGETYVNECELRKQSCRTKTNIEILHEGKCGKALLLASIGYVVLVPSPDQFSILVAFVYLSFPTILSFLS